MYFNTDIGKAIIEGKKNYSFKFFVENLPVWFRALVFQKVKRELKGLENDSIVVERSPPNSILTGLPSTCIPLFFLLCSNFRLHVHK